MQTYKTETTVSGSGQVTISDLPFQPGDKVEVIINRKSEQKDDSIRYPLRGQPVHYTDPFDSVAQEDWELLR